MPFQVPKKRRFTTQQLEAFKKEMRIWSRLYHPNICLFMGAYVHPDKVLIVTEIMEGDLESLLKKNKKLSLYTRMKMAKEAAQGIAWLHGQNPKGENTNGRKLRFFAHLAFANSHTSRREDVKLSVRQGVPHQVSAVDPHVRVMTKSDKNRICRVCDFGLSDLAEKNIQDLSGAKGTLLYMAPEVMMGAPFNEKADVYSFGIVMWEILTFTEPFPHHTNVPGFVKAVAHEGERPVIPPGTPLSLVSLMQDCWKAQYDQRPTFIEICDRLDVVIVDAAIRDPQGNAFWKRAFQKQERVSFDDFSRSFYAFLGLNRPDEAVALEDSSMSGYVTSDFMFDSEGVDPDAAMDLSMSRGPGGGGGSNNAPLDLAVIGIRLLRALVASDTMNPSEAMVHIFTFGKVLDSMGPLDVNFMARMTDLCSQKWFFGGISTEVAVKTLLNEPRGAFLVRFCNHPNLPGYYVISKVTRAGKVIHIRIKHAPGSTFCVEGTDQEYASLQQLVQTSQYLHLETDKAANGSKFWAIFTRTAHNQQVAGYANPDEPYAMELVGDGE